MASKIDRVGETRVMKCGMEAIIIRYGGATDIDVRFEDEAVAVHKRYDAFKKGKINNPNIKASAENRFGETKMMNCGMEATIIRYGGATDIDVRFEDGAVAKNKAYGEFKKGGIAHPSTTAKARLGETRMMNCGMKATIIRYENADDINICFEDGKVVEHKTYRAFKKGYIAHQNTNVPVEARLGETRMMNCGMEATITRYENNMDIDVRFEDGTVAKRKAYSAFKKGSIVNQNFNSRLNEAKMMNCGMKATIIRYGRYTDIDVRFEDGTVMKHRGYGDFKKGEIANSNIKTFAETRLGETRMMNCGMEAAIIRYNGVRDIDVRFEDGATVKHKVYGPFKRGEVAHRLISLKYGSKDFHGFVCKQGFIDEDRTLYECICKHCGLEDVLTPQEMIEHEKLEHGGDE